MPTFLNGIAKEKNFMRHQLTNFCKCFLLLVWTSCALAQSANDSDRAAKIALDALHRREIPEASPPFTNEEAKWWNELRAAGEAVRKTMGAEKETKKFLALLKSGSEKSYQPPIANRAAIVLRQLPFQSTKASREKKISGSMALVAELRPDGTVGEVKVVQGLGYGLDEKAIEAAHQLIFLPSVKERKFVTVYLPITMSVATRHTYP